MTDNDRDRGAYTPSGEPPLAFDARQSGSSGGAGRPPMTLIISALILLVLVVALIFYYRSGVRRAGEPPVVGAPVGSMKEAPPASAQSSDTASGLQVYRAEQGEPASSAAPTFAAAPEEPLPRIGPREPASAAPPANAAPPAAAPAPQSSAPPATVKPPAPKPAPVQTAAPKPPAPKPAPAPLAVPAAGTASGGSMVQIGAFTSIALADKGWNDVAKLAPGRMAGRTKKFEPVVKGDDTLYRAFVGGFSSRADASAFCEALKGAGHACFVK